MPLKAESLHPVFAARVTGLDMTQPLTSGEVAEVRALMDRYAVCVYPNATPLSNDQHIAFARHLGPMQRGRVLTVTGRRERLEDWPELVDVGNLDVDGNIRPAESRARAFNNANRLWHTDMSFHPNRATYSLLNSHVIPVNGEGDTEFADERAAYDALPAAMKVKIDGLVAMNNSLAALGVPTVQPHRARIGALARTVAETLVARSPRLRAGGHSIELRGQAAIVDGEWCEVAPAPMALLRALAASPGRVVSRRELIAALPGGGEEHAVETAIGRLRTSLGGGKVVQTVVKRGYRLAVDA